MNFDMVLSKHGFFCSNLFKRALSVSILFFLLIGQVNYVNAEESASVFDMFEEEGDEETTAESSEPLPVNEPVEKASAKKDNRSTAEKLEDLKQEVLDVNRDLYILEEDLLFPASTQLALYFSVDIGYFFNLDNIKIKLDDKQVTHHLYTQKDVNALLKGAIQKLFIKNVSTGEHELVIILIGTGPHKRDYRLAKTFQFTKGTDGQSVEIQLRDNTSKLQPKLNVVEW